MIIARRNGDHGLFFSMCEHDKLDDAAPVAWQVAWGGVQRLDVVVIAGQRGAQCTVDEFQLWFELSWRSLAPLQEHVR